MALFLKTMKTNHWTLLAVSWSRLRLRITRLTESAAEIDTIDSLYGNGLYINAIVIVIVHQILGINDLHRVISACDIKRKSFPIFIHASHVCNLDVIQVKVSEVKVLFAAALVHNINGSTTSKWERKVECAVDEICVILIAAVNVVSVKSPRLANTSWDPTIRLKLDGKLVPSGELCQRSSGIASSFTFTTGERRWAGIQVETTNTTGICYSFATKKSEQKEECRRMLDNDDKPQGIVVTGGRVTSGVGLQRAGGRQKYVTFRVPRASSQLENE